jgi:hypothetical protein
MALLLDEFILFFIISVLGCGLGPVVLLGVTFVGLSAHLVIVVLDPLSITLKGMLSLSYHEVHFL